MVEVAEGIHVAPIGELLAAALAMTEAALLACPGEDAVGRMLAARAPLLDAAERARDGGAAWGEAESELARRMLAADARLLGQLRGAHADAFAWLAVREPATHEAFPELSKVLKGTAQESPTDAGGEAPRTSVPAMSVAARYFKTSRSE